MTETILTLNAGSSSLKFQLFAIDHDLPRQEIKGQIDGIGNRPRLFAADALGPIVERSFAPHKLPDLPAALELLRDWIEEPLNGRLPIAVGHRIVHGGVRFDRPLRIDKAILEELESLAPLAPLHQPNNLAPIRAIQQLLPELPQIACFDTAFHRNHSELVERFAIPQWLHDEGVRRYGFHGLSYEYIAGVLPEVAPEAAQARLIVAHLGNGASLCAMRDGRSLDSSMGFTALDGLPMGTRPGQIDPGIPLYLLTEKGMTVAEIEHLLYHDCGLLGLSGISSDMRDLEQSDDLRARFAVQFFAYRIAREIAALTAVLGGLDAVVFTAGIGENSARVRKAVCDRLKYFGITLDAAANMQNALRISLPGASPAVYVIPTDEELMIAKHAIELMKTSPRPSFAHELTGPAP